MLLFAFASHCGFDQRFLQLIFELLHNLLHIINSDSINKLSFFSLRPQSDLNEFLLKITFSNFTGKSGWGLAF